MQSYAKVFAAVLLAATMSGAAFAQTGDIPPLGSQPQPGAAGSENSVNSPFIIEPEAQIEGDRIKRETYRSQPAGQNHNWNLDIGRFQPQINEDPNRVAPDSENTYSGMRFRLPLRGGLGQNPQ